MVYGPLQWWYSWTGKPEDIQRDFVQKLLTQANTVVYPPRLLPTFIRYEEAAPSGILVRHDITEDVGGFDEAFRGMYEDQVFRTKVCLKAPVFVSSRCWYRWRKHPDSTCSVAVNTGRYHSARLTFLKWVEKYLSDHGVKDTEIWKALQKELWPYRHPILYRLLRPAQYLVRRRKELLKQVAQRS
jgi:GT2 family glycosyltransferase